MNTKYRKKVIFFLPSEKHKEFVDELSSILWTDFSIKSHKVIINEEDIDDEEVSRMVFFLGSQIICGSEKVLFVILKEKNRFSENLRKYLTKKTKISIIELENNKSNNDLSDFMINIFEADFKNI